MMAIRGSNEGLFRSLRDGDPLLGVLDILRQLIMPGKESVHMKLMDEYKQKLEMGSCAGFRMLAHYGSERVQMRLIDEFPEKLDVKGPFVNAGWLLLETYGSEAIRARLRTGYQEKLSDVE